MKSSAKFSEKNLKRLIERFKANHLETLQSQAGEGGLFEIDDQHNLWRGKVRLGSLKLKGERVIFDPPIEQASGPNHAPTEADIRHWALVAWDRAPSDPVTGANDVAGSA